MICKILVIKQRYVSREIARFFFPVFLQFIPWLREHHGDNQHAADRNESEELEGDYADRKMPSFIAV